MADLVFINDKHYQKSKCGVVLDKKLHVLRVETIDYVLKGRRRVEMHHTYMFNYDDLTELPIKVKKFTYK